MGLISYWLESLDYDYKILPHCSLYQSPLSSCTRCIDSCPENAIQLKDGKPVINTTKCTQCGDCIASCPVQGVEGFLPKRSIINNQFVIDPQSIPSIKELLIYYKKGITTLIYEKKELPLLWKTTIEDTNKLLAKLGEQPFNIINKHKSVDDCVKGFLPKRSIINNQFVIDPQSIPSIKELLIYYKKGITTLIYEKKELPLLWKTTIEDTNKLLAKLGEQPFNIINKHKSVDDSV